MNENSVTTEVASSGDRSRQYDRQRSHQYDRQQYEKERKIHYEYNGMQTLNQYFHAASSAAHAVNDNVFSFSSMATQRETLHGVQPINITPLAVDYK